MRRAIVFVALVLLVAACSSPAEAGVHERPALGVANGTTLTVTLVVNGQPVATFEPGQPGPTIDVGRLRGLPWDVEARSASGRVLTTMRVKPGDVYSTSGPGNQTRESGTLGRVDLSCGRLDIWAGLEPSGPIPPSTAGSPGDCMP
jgi:hypothetical protein